MGLCASASRTQFLPIAGFKATAFKLHSTAANGLRLRLPKMSVRDMRKLILVLILMASSALAACVTAAQQQQAQQAEDARLAALAKQMLDEANRYCVETGQKPGTQLYSDCVNTNAMQRAAIYKMTQMAANPALAPVYAPAPSPVDQRPPRYPNTAAGNFAAGLTGGSVYDSPSSPPPRAPIICNTFGNTTTCQ
jgi:hypothetical protein